MRPRRRRSSTRPRAGPPPYSWSGPGSVCCSSALCCWWSMATSCCSATPTAPPWPGWACCSCRLCCRPGSAKSTAPKTVGRPTSWAITWPSPCSSRSTSARTRTLCSRRGAERLSWHGVGEAGTDVMDSFRSQVGQGLDRDEPSAAQDPDPVGHPLHLGENVRGQQHARAFGRSLPDQCVELLLDQGIQPAGWLVEQDQLGLTHEGEDQRDLLPVALGQTAQWPREIDVEAVGQVFAQNMMYQHTITVYRADGTLAATIPDSVDLAAYRIAGHPGQVRGAPVEAASSPDHKSMYVSNYSMYGAGFGPEGSDACTSGDGIDPSTLYRIDTTRLAVDGVVQVGAVPKYVAVTPDGRFVLVSNWCSGTLSVVDRTSLTEVRQVRLGRYPRGIAVDPHSRTADVAVMGSSDVARVDLSTFAVSWLRGIGSGPRHLVLDSTGRFLYVTLNGDGRVAKVDTDSGRVVARVATGRAPRSMTIAADGRSLYVVNYESDTVTKLRADDLTVLQSVPTNASPIGITYEPTRDQLWIACYTGSIQIFSDT